MIWWHPFVYLRVETINLLQLMCVVHSYVRMARLHPFGDTPSPKFVIKKQICGVQFHFDGIIFVNTAPSWCGY